MPEHLHPSLLISQHPVFPAHAAQIQVCRYYTYVLDKVIALDFFSQFNKDNLLNGPTAMRYRRSVLEPGATKPAADLVKTFLARPQNIDALQTWMNVEFQTIPASKSKSGQ
jgi:thimet oligopeptidase